MGVGIKHETAGGWENDFVTIEINVPNNLPSFAWERDAPTTVRIAPRAASPGNALFWQSVMSGSAKTARTD